MGQCVFYFVYGRYVVPHICSFDRGHFKFGYSTSTIPSLTTIAYNTPHCMCHSAIMHHFFLD